MLYQKEIDDYVLIQFIILFTLNNADAPLLYRDLVNIVMENCNINFNDFQIALGNLTETNHVRDYMEGERRRMYTVTQKGSAAGEFFARHIPVYIREPILESIKQLYIEERRRHAVQSGIVPVRRDEYGAEFSLFDDDKTEIMKLSLYTGSRDEAERMVKFFRKNYSDVYEKILNAFADANDDGNNNEE